MTDRAVALQIVQGMPGDASLNEIADRLWSWHVEQHSGLEVDRAVADFWSTIDPVRLVSASRSAREVAILGVSRGVAHGVITALPDQTSMDEIVAAITGWSWPDSPSE